MKCPKCGYLGYQDVERCRNCGYEFSLASTSSSVDLRLREAEVAREPIGDLDLIDSRIAASAQQTPAEPARSTPVNARPVHGDELPLFGGPIADDVPLITKASPPRPPLAVRRATPEVPRLRAEARMPLAESPVGESLTPASVTKPEPPFASAPFTRHEPITEPEAHDESFRPATRTERAMAAVIDIALLLFVDAIVVYFSLKVCRLAPSEIRLLPPVPVGAFLLLQNGGYLVAFTTAGQTLGKMMTGLRVMGLDRDSSPGVGRATARALLTMLLALPVGLGLLPALFSRDGRGLHDRLAGTRVVHTGD